jgi:hypothetical protein
MGHPISQEDLDMLETCNPRVFKNTVYIIGGIISIYCILQFII